jgi:hypothetical protein
MPDLENEFSTEGSVSILQLRRIESYPQPLKADIGQSAQPQRRPAIESDEEHLVALCSKLPIFQLDLPNRTLEIESCYSALATHAGVRNNATLSAPFAAHLSSQSFVNTGLGPHFSPSDFILHSAHGSAMIATSPNTLETTWNLLYRQRQLQQLHQIQQSFHHHQRCALPNFLLGHHSVSSLQAPCPLPSLSDMPAAAAQF